MSDKRKYLDIVQVFRGLAALMVVFHHIEPSISFYQQKSFGLFQDIAGFGKYGVDFFFILSGFIITYTNYDKKRTIPSYLKRRFARIYVPYIPISIVVLILYLYIPNVSNASREISLLTSLTLIPYGTPALSVAWTLIYEMMFYLLFVLCLINKRLWDVFLVIWVFAVILANVFFTDITNVLLQHLLSFYNIEFILGYLLGRVFLQNYIISKKVVISLIIGFTSMLIYGKYFVLETTSPILNIMFSMSAFGLIYYYLTYNNRKISSTNVFMLIGNATYSIYLTHNIIIPIINRLLPVSNSNLLYVLYIVILFVISIVIGYVYYLIFEVRAMNLILGYIIGKKNTNIK